MFSAKPTSPPDIPSDRQRVYDKLNEFQFADIMPSGIFGEQIFVPIYEDDPNSVGTLGYASKQFVTGLFHTDNYWFRNQRRSFRLGTAVETERLYVNDKDTGAVNGKYLGDASGFVSVVADEKTGNVKFYIRDEYYGVEPGQVVSFGVGQQIPPDSNFIFEYNASTDQVDFSNGIYSDYQSEAYDLYFTNGNGNTVLKEVKQRLIPAITRESAINLGQNVEGFKETLEWADNESIDWQPRPLNKPLRYIDTAYFRDGRNADEAVMSEWAAQRNSGVIDPSVTFTNEGAAASQGILNMVYDGFEPVIRTGGRFGGSDSSTDVEYETYRPNTNASSGGGRGSERDYTGPLYYPSTLASATEDRDTVKFTAIGGTGGPVILPINSKISDSNSVDWSGATLNALQAIAAEASIAAIGSNNLPGFGEEITKGLEKAIKPFVGAGGEGISEEAKIFLAQQAVGAQGLLSRYAGKVLNPNMELLFNGPSLRSFNFSFLMSAIDKDDLSKIKKIIKFFKQNMAVKGKPGDAFLEKPARFRIDYGTNGGANHKSINLIGREEGAEPKACALVRCDVDYTPAGTYMTYKDPEKTMSAYAMSLQFSEIEPIFESDYGGHPIGY